MSINPTWAVAPDEVIAVLAGSPMGSVSDDTATWAAQTATAMVAGYLRLPLRAEVPEIKAEAIRPIATSLACRLAVNSGQLRRWAMEVEGTSYSFTPSEAGFTLAELFVLRRFRQTTG